ncbi:MAG: hypothetical protein Kow0099_06650 [Candidatus Abyssubacteria bacterium]
MRAKHEEALVKLAEIETAGASEWESVKAGWREIIDDIQQGLDRALSRLR